MKKLILSAAIGMIGIFGSCAQEDLLDTGNQTAEGTTISASMDDLVEQVPQSILDYVAANYAGVAVVYAEPETDASNANIAYEVHLADGTDVYFNTAGEFLFAETSGDSDDNDMAVADIPQNILDYIAANYPGVTIQDANSEDNNAIEVELSNDLDLYFDAAGNLIGIDTDDNSDDDNDDSNDGASDDDAVSLADLPQSILDYVAANYPDATILEASLKDDDGIEVELDNNLDLHFSSTGSFLSAEPSDNSGSGSGGGSEIPIDSLPQAILDYIAANYPGVSIEKAKTEDNGGYEVELSNNVNVYFDADGNFLMAVPG